MKKLNSILHDEKVQGKILLTVVFVSIVLILVLTWGK